MRFWKSLEPAERKFLVILTAVCLFLGASPHVFGYLVRPDQSVFSWIGAFNVPDWNVYYMYLRQAAAGHLLFSDLYTLEPQNLFTFNVFWFLLGFLGKIFFLSPPIIFHAARLLLIPVAVFFIYRIVSAALPAGRGLRYFAALLAAFGAGFGVFLFPTGNGRLITMDINSPDGWPYVIFMFSPHFLAALILFLAVIWFFSRALAENKAVFSAAAGLLGLILFNFHPYHFIVLYFTAIIGSIIFTHVKNISLSRALFHLSLLVGLSFPSLFYHAWLAFSDSVIAGRHGQNVTPAGGAADVFMAYGLLLIGAAYSIYVLLRARKETHLRILLAIAPFVALLFMLSGFPNGRRLVMGLTIPLGIFTAEAVWRVLPRLKIILRQWPILVAVPLVLFFGTTAFNISYAYGFYVNPGREMFEVLSYHDKNRVALLDWLRRQPPGSMRILSHWFMGNIIPAESGQYVFVGHWAETLDYLSKVRGVLRFFSKDVTEKERPEFLQKNGITHVLYSSYEASLGDWNPHESWYLRPSFKAGDYVIYEVYYSASGS